MLPRGGGGGGSGVSSYNTRTGAVTSQASDVAAAITPGTSGNVMTSSGSAWASSAAPAAVSSVSNGDGLLSVSPTTGAVVVNNGTLAPVGANNTFSGNNAFNNVLSLKGGTSTSVITSGSIPALSGVMSHVAAGSAGTADQNTTGRDICVSIQLTIANDTAGTAVLQISPDNSSDYVTVGRFNQSALTGQNEGVSFFVVVPAGWWLQFSTFSGYAISGAHYF